MKSNKEVYQIIKDYFNDKPVKKIQVFGSFARDEQDEDSDIDILLEMEQPVGLITFSAYIVDLEKLLDIKVDLGTTNGISPYAEPIIKRDLKTVYEK